MRIVVDTNIVFSAVLNSTSKIANIILQPKSKLNFYATSKIRNELAEHWTKLKQISKLSETDLHSTSGLIFSKISFINVQLIPKSILLKAQALTETIDIDDTEFVALTEHIRGKLWSGDKKLIRGLKQAGWNKIISTEDIYKISRQK